MIPATRRPLPGFVLAACAAIAMVSMTLGTMGPLLPHLKAEMHSSLYAGLVIAGHPIGSLLAAIPTLLASRRFGLPRVIAAGAVLAFGSSLLFVWPGHGWWIVLARIGFGASGTIVWQSVFAWTISNAAPGRRARTIGLLLAASTAGWLVGPQLGALAVHVGLWVCAIPPLLLTVTAMRFGFASDYETVPRPGLEQVRASLRSRQTLAGAGLNSGTAIVQMSVGVALPLALSRDGLGAFGIGAVLTFASATMILINPLAGRLSDRGHTRTLVTADLVLLSLALAGLAVASHAAAGTTFAYATLCTSGVPGMIGTVLMSRGVAAAGLEQTVSQTIGTLSWAPLAIIGAVAAGAVPSPARWLLFLAVSCAVAAVVAAVARAHRRTPQLA